MGRLFKRIVIALGLGALAKVAWRPMVLFRLTVAGRRGPLSRTPGDVGLDYSDVSFPATDGVGLAGWFIPAASSEPRSPAVVFVHGWPWNRLGNVAGQVPIPDRSVDFLVPARALHDAGYHVLLFDLRNHGESERDIPLTFGIKEGKDFAGAVRFVAGRDDVDPERIGAIGYSAGANTVLYGLPLAPPVRAAILAQPTKVAAFNKNFAKTEFGAFGPAILAMTNITFKLLGAPMSAHDPAAVARQAGETVTRFVQGSGDPWGSMEIVEEMARAVPRGLMPVVVAPSTERYEGYRYMENNVEEVVSFFDEYLKK
jgi:dienelactone hydrolase